jgi:hypothetical protein
MKLQLRQLRGPESGRVYPVGEKGLFMGRPAPGNTPDIALSDPRVSRRHLALFFNGGKLFAQGASDNVVLVNGVKLAGARALAPGDRIEIYDALFALEKTALPVRTRAAVLAAAVLAVLGLLAAVLVDNSRAPVPGTVNSPKTARAAHPALLPDSGAGLSWALLTARNRDARPENRTLALYEFKRIEAGAADSLKAVCQKNIRELEAEIDSLFHLYKTQADIAFRQNRTGLCRRYLDKMAGLVPDVNDARHAWVRNARKKLRSRRGR